MCKWHFVEQGDNFAVAPNFQVTTFQSPHMTYVHCTVHTVQHSQQSRILFIANCTLQTVEYVFIMVKMFVEPTQERDRCCTLLTKLESSLATLYKIIFTKFSNKYLKRRSSMSPDFLNLHIHFQKKIPDKIVSKFKRQFVMSVILCRQMLNWI